MSDRDHNWRGFHLFYHGDLDLVVTDFVAPLADELSNDWFFLRHWDGGPHIRLRVRANEDLDARRLANLVRRRSRQFFDRHPSQDTLSTANYLASARTFARYERISTFTPKPFANNSMAIVPYARDHRRYGRGASIEAVEAHFVEASRLAIRLLSAGLTGTRLPTAGYSLIVLAWLCAGVADDALLHNLTKLWEPWQRGQGRVVSHEALLRLTGQLRDIARQAEDEPDDRPLAAWAASIIRLRDRLTGPAGPRRSILDTCAHLACNRLGVPLAQEAHLRGFAAAALTGAMAR